MGVKEKEFRSRNRRQDLVDARCLVAAALISQPFMRQEDVAGILGTTQATVSHMLARHSDLLQVDFTYKRKWETVKSSIKK